MYPYLSLWFKTCISYCLLELLAWNLHRISNSAYPELKSESFSQTHFNLLFLRHLCLFLPFPSLHPVPADSASQINSLKRFLFPLLPSSYYCGPHLPFFFGQTGMQDLKFPNQGSNPCPLQRKLRVLTTGPPGNSSSFSKLLCTTASKLPTPPIVKPLHAR